MYCVLCITSLLILYVTIYVCILIGTDMSKYMNGSRIALASLSYTTDDGLDVAFS
jgi:hypothetical protein